MKAHGTNYKAAQANWFNDAHPARQPRPKHKPKNNDRGSFLAASGVASIRREERPNRIKLPYLGSVRLGERLPEDAVISKATISRSNGKWYIALTLRVSPPEPEVKRHDFGGLDVGITPLAADSEGVEYLNPKAYYQSLRQRRLWQRRLARRRGPDERKGIKPSIGWLEAKRRLDKIERRIVGLRGNAHHQMSRSIVRKYAVLGIETLNVRGMDKLRFQAKAIRDAAIGGLLRQVEYKAKWYGTEIVKADRWFPSSKTCSVCGFVNKLLKREREWDCPNCGVSHDRNLNAAKVLQRLAETHRAAEMRLLAVLKAGLGAVCADVTPPETQALANGNGAVRETGVCDGGRAERPLAAGMLPSVAS